MSSAPDLPPAAVAAAASRAPRRAVAFAGLALAGFGLAGWAACAAWGVPAQAWRALLVSFIFFTPLASAMVAWPAIVMLSRGQWMGPVARDARAGIVLAPLSLAAFAVLWAGRAHWALWLYGAALPNRVWLGDAFLFGRDGAALLLWWLVALAFVLKTRDGARPKAFAAWVALLYPCVLSLLAFDLVMALDPRWSSALFGGYFFVTGLYAAIATLALAAVLRREPDRDRLHDLGKLILTFSIMTTYLAFSQLLPIWYANFPREARFVVPRLNGPPWTVVSAALLPVVYLGPLVLLLTARAKRTPAWLGAVALLVLAGLWVERAWLVGPTLGQPPHAGLADLAAAAACVGVLGFGLARFGAGAGTPEGRDGD